MLDASVEVIPSVVPPVHISITGAGSHGDLSSFACRSGETNISELVGVAVLFALANRLRHCKGSTKNS